MFEIVSEGASNAAPLGAHNPSSNGCALPMAAGSPEGKSVLSKDGEVLGIVVFLISGGQSAWII